MATSPYLDGINIMRDHHQLGLLVLHQGGHCVDTCETSQWSELREGLLLALNWRRTVVERKEEQLAAAQG